MDEMRKVLVFDYDGVLADTERLHWKSWAALLLPYDIQLTWEEYCSFGRGVDDAQMCVALGDRMPLVGTPELLRQNCERRRMVRDWSLAEIPIPQETVQLLTTLGAHRIGLVTSSEQADLEPVLRAAAIFETFDAMVFGHEVAAHKPAPDPYLLIAQKLGVKTGIAFEDSVPGVESALAAGFEVVRVEQPSELAHLVERSLHGETTS
jgi:beta-phosphoglucomutase